MTLTLLSGPDWPAVGHPCGAHHGCGGLLVWRWVPAEGVDTIGAVECKRCGGGPYVSPRAYMEGRATNAPTDADVLASMAADVPDDDEDATVGWVPKSPHMQAWAAARGVR